MLEIRGKASLNCATVGNMTVWRGRAFQCVTVRGKKEKGLVHKWPKMALYIFFLKSLLVVDNDGALSKSTIKTVKIISLRCYGNMKMNL